MPIFVICYSIVSTSVVFLIGIQINAKFEKCLKIFFCFPEVTVENWHYFFKYLMKLYSEIISAMAFYIGRIYTIISNYLIIKMQFILHIFLCLVVTVCWILQHNIQIYVLWHIGRNALWFSFIIVEFSILTLLLMYILYHVYWNSVVYWTGIEHILTTISYSWGSSLFKIMLSSFVSRIVYLKYNLNCVNIKL